MNLPESLVAAPWIGWALVLVLGYPLAAVVLSEILERFEERGRPLRGPIRHVRNITLPLIALLVFLQKLIGLPPQDTVVKLAYTVTLVSVFFALLSLANVMLFSEASEDSWRARVPKLFLDLSRLFFVFLGVAMVLALVWEQDLKGLFAALGIGSLVIGLALQDTLGNLFSGVALLFEKPFAVGEFVRIGEREGKIVEMTWRTTRIHVGATHSILVIPNLALAKEQVVNLSRPGLHVVRVPIRFSHADAPNAVKAAMIEIATSLSGVLAEPAPSVTTLGYGESWIDYEVSFAVGGYAARGGARNEFMSRLWYAARRSGLHLPVPPRTIASETAAPAFGASADASSVYEALAGIPVLQGLPEEVVLELSASGVLRRFARDEIVFREGDRGTTMYIVVSGDVLLTTPDQKGVEREVMRLSPGDFIGLSQVVLRQPSSVCARAMTDLALVAIPGEAASRLLDRSPRLASDLGEAQEARRKATLQAKQGHTNAVGGIGS